MKSDDEQQDKRRRKRVPIVTEYEGRVLINRAAELLDVNRSRIHQLIDEGVLDAITLGSDQMERNSVMLVSVDSINAYLANPERRKKPGPPRGQGGRPPKSKEQDDGQTG